MHLIETHRATYDAPTGATYDAPSKRHLRCTKQALPTKHQASDAYEAPTSATYEALYVAQFLYAPRPNRSKQVQIRPNKPKRF